MNYANFKNSKNKYPVSTDVLDFMQEQIKFVSTLSGIAGGNAILKQSTSDEDGLLVFNGELLLIKKSAPNAYITITEETRSIVAKGETFTDARVIRHAQYTSNSLGSNSYAASNFTLVENLIAQKELNQHHVPKGTVIDWYGEASCDNIPYGWVPCGYFYKRTGGDYTKNLASEEVLDEESKWKSLYSNISSETICHYIGSNYSFLRITKVGDMEIPNLSGRFVVGAGYSGNTSIGSYNKGEFGGESKRTLKESDLPAHTHELEGLAVQGGNLGGTGHYGSWIKYTGTTTDRTGGTISRGSSNPTSFEIIPPYFALYKLIKVI